MWYFSWILGLGLACTASILNAMWFELLEDQHEHGDVHREPRDPE